MRHSKGGITYQDIEGMDPDELSEWAKSIEWLLRKEYPDAKK